MLIAYVLLREQTYGMCIYYNIYFFRHFQLPDLQLIWNVCIRVPFTHVLTETGALGCILPATVRGDSSSQRCQLSADTLGPLFSVVPLYINVCSGSTASAYELVGMFARFGRKLM